MLEIMDILPKFTIELSHHKVKWYNKKDRLSSIFFI